MADSLALVDARLDIGRADLQTPLPAADSVGTGRPGLLGRAEECRRIAGYVERLAAGPSAGEPRSLVLVGEAGIGKSSLWQHALELGRSAGARVLLTRPSDDDRHHPGQGLLDLFASLDAGDLLAVPAGDLRTGVLDPTSPVSELTRAVLDLLRRLAAEQPVVLAVDDLPWLDDLTWRCLRFSLRRLSDHPVAMFATARTWSPHPVETAVPALDDRVDVLEVPRLPLRVLRRIVRAAVPTLPGTVAGQVGELAHGNPFFALELARARRPGAAATATPPLTVLGERVRDLGPATLELARLLALAGPGPLAVFGAAVPDLPVALKPGLAAGVLGLDDDFVLRFSHPLYATAVLAGTDSLERLRLHAVLAGLVDDADAQTYHLARSAVGPDPVLAERVEQTAVRLARRGAPRRAADLFADSIRLTPPDADEDRVRRTVGQMMQRATAGDLPTALQVADELLDALPPGCARAAVVSCRVSLDFTDAEAYLRRALADVPDDDDPHHGCLRGRLLGLLGWLIGIHLGRPAEGLAYARQALEIGRARGDHVLMTQAAVATSTASLLAGRRADELIEAAEAAEVVRSQLVLWPAVLRGRQQLWDGRLASARQNFASMLATAETNGAEIQLCYRHYDLALVEVAAGELDLAARHAEAGLEAAADCRDERAISWLAYPVGMIAALRGDEARAEWAAARLTWWADSVGERPRAAMAAHVSALLSAARQDWSGGLQIVLKGLADLEALGWVHPGPVPLLPLGIQLATLADRPDRVAALTDLLRRRCQRLGSPWADAHLIGARAQVALFNDGQAAFEALLAACERLCHLGYVLDAARLGCLAAAAGLRAGQRRAVVPIVERSLEALRRQGVRGWDDLAAELACRASRGADSVLTATESQVARLVVEGQRNREIAGRLFVSESTVEAHLTRMYRKLAVRNRAELVRHLAAQPA